jgi:cytochrome b subunit of formate dehydrogenase
VTRFSRLERLEHLGAMLTFILLVATGLPQTAPDNGVALWLIQLFGGVAPTRLVHRTTGFIFVALLVLHIARGVIGIARTRTLPAIIPRRHDFFDALAMARHILQGTPRPKAGKFDGTEKFEYWGLFFGGIIMSVTGVVLVFPELVTEVFPGIVVAALRVVHGLEATFAVLVVLLWHSYGVLLRPEIFPLDTSMFTGKISLDRLREEHELEFDEIFPDGAPADAD